MIDQIGYFNSHFTELHQENVTLQLELTIARDEVRRLTGNK